MSDEHVWTYDYANDGNGFFCEWWNILRDGDKIGTVTTSEDDAKMICALLNAAERLSVACVRDIMCDYPMDMHPYDALEAYADIREGKKA